MGQAKQRDMSVHRVPKAGEWIMKGYTPGLEAFEGFLLTTCFWEQGLLFYDTTLFRFCQSYLWLGWWELYFMFECFDVLSRKAMCKSVLCSVF